MSRVIHYSGQAPRVDPGRVQVTIDGAEHLLRGPLVEGEVVVTLDGELHCASCRKKAAFQVERSHHPLAAWSFACCQCGTTVIVKRARPQVPKPLRTPCGFFSASVTSDPRQVTCRTCSRLVQPLLASAPTPTPKPEKPTMRTAISTALFCLTALAAACGTPVAGLTTSDESTSTTAVDSSSDPDLLTSSGPVMSGGEDASTSTASTSVISGPGAGTLDDAGIPPDDTSTSSTSDTTGTSSSSGGDTIDTSTSEDSTTTSEGGAGEPVVCYGDPCSAVGCASDMTCVPSPPTGLAVCVTPCTPDEPCIIAAFVCDPDVGPHGVCKQDDTGMGWCFPK